MSAETIIRCALALIGIEAETWEPVEIIELSRAQLCENCQGITRIPNDHCPACGSRSVISLGKVLNRA